MGRHRGRLGKPRTVATDRIFRIPAADVNDAGRIALAYVRTTHLRNRKARLFVSHGRHLRHSLIVSRRGGVNAVTVAVGPRGDIVVAWERNGKIEARIRRPGHRLGRVVPVGKGARLQTRLRAAVAASGRAWIAWESKRIDGEGTNVELQTAVSSARRSDIWTATCSRPLRRSKRAEFGGELRPVTRPPWDRNGRVVELRRAELPRAARRF